ncbi:uncharacterized protein LOC118196871 [Stegodyphus dumicola]|uniref:uncharacterized protein LOC118196871 n=1 Tax=Stegodyphus dumicola TaxID=202533 RepID=UPI0015B2086B|nr:uncharacterized protein LOC118196871 [Stegodyphus dumicola]
MYDISSSSKTKCLVEPIKADNFVKPVVVLSKISSDIVEKYICSDDSSSEDEKRVASVTNPVENSEHVLKSVTSCNSGDCSSPTEKNPLVISLDDSPDHRESDKSLLSGVSSLKDMKLTPLVVNVEDSPKHDGNSEILSPDCCIVSPVEKKPSPVVITLEDPPSDACKYLTENEMNSTSDSLTSPTDKKPILLSPNLKDCPLPVTETSMITSQNFSSSIIKKEPTEPLTENHERKSNLVVENCISLNSDFSNSETVKRHTILPKSSESPVIQNNSSSGHSSSSEDKHEKLVKCLKGWASSILQNSKCVNSGVSFLTTDKNQVLSVQSLDGVSTTSKKLKEVTNCNKNVNSEVYSPSSSCESRDMPLTSVLEGDSNSAGESSTSSNPVKPELIDLT